MASCSGDCREARPGQAGAPARARAGEDDKGCRPPDGPCCDTGKGAARMVCVLRAPCEAMRAEWAKPHQSPGHPWGTGHMSEAPLEFMLCRPRRQARPAAELPAEPTGHQQVSSSWLGPQARGQGSKGTWSSGMVLCPELPERALGSGRGPAQDRQGQGGLPPGSAAGGPCESRPQRLLGQNTPRTAGSRDGRGQATRGRGLPVGTDFLLLG